MEKEIYILLGATITALFGYIVARYTSGIQLKIAQKIPRKIFSFNWIV
ncbi:hypothetical protein [Acinetobacter bereziniae]|nr:hypothetical protein [Acinetobacter bereziniae]